VFDGNYASLSPATFRVEQIDEVGFELQLPSQPIYPITQGYHLLHGDNYLGIDLCRTQTQGTIILIRRIDDDPVEEAPMPPTDYALCGNPGEPRNPNLQDTTGHQNPGTADKMQMPTATDYAHYGNPENELHPHLLNSTGQKESWIYPSTVEETPLPPTEYAIYGNPAAAANPNMLYANNSQDALSFPRKEDDMPMPPADYTCYGKYGTV
jgi:hypothetical protein